MAYLHIIEPGISGAATIGEENGGVGGAWVRERSRHRVISTGDHTASSAISALRGGAADAVGFGRLFLANPDLPERLASDAALNEAIRETYYGGGDEGYIDYPSLDAQELLANLRRRPPGGVEDALLEVQPLGAATPLAEWPLAWALDQLRGERDLTSVEPA